MLLCAPQFLWWLEDAVVCPVNHISFCFLLPFFFSSWECQHELTPPHIYFSHLPPPFAHTHKAQKISTDNFTFCSFFSTATHIPPFYESLPLQTLDLWSSTLKYLFIPCGLGRIPSPSVSVVYFKWSTSGTDTQGPGYQHTFKYGSTT